MIGAIVGNMIGVPHEFTGNRFKDFKPLLPESLSMDDDSLLTIATAYALQNGGNFAGAYRKFCKDCPNLPYGARFRQWLSTPDAPPYNSKGNGAAMRVSPVAWFYDNLNDVLQAAEESAKVTHNHPEGILSAKIVAHIIFACRNGASKDDVRNITKSYNYPIKNSVIELQESYQYTELAIETVIPAIICFLDSENYEDAVRNACSIGGDADTLAAIVGSIAEAFYGTKTELWDIVKSQFPLKYVKIIESI